MSNVTNAIDMFQYAGKLKTIYCNDDWSGISSGNNMFSNCTSLKGAAAFDSEKLDAAMANATTGYFTAQADIDVIADNSSALAEANGKWTELTFTGRTIYLDGHWNTLCLPIGVSTEAFGSLSSTPGFGLVELTGASLDDAGKLTLTFSDATSIEAGKPYLIKFPNLGTTLSEVKLTGVVDNTASTEVSLNGGRVKFIGTWSPIDVPASENTLYLDADDQLNWNNTDSQLQGTRAYFQLDPSLAASAKEFLLSFGGSQTGIQSIQGKEVKEVIFNLQGQRLNGLQKGINIVNGKKIYVK